MQYPDPTVNLNTFYLVSLGTFWVFHHHVYQIDGNYLIWMNSKNPWQLQRQHKSFLCEHASHAIKGRSFRSFFINVWLTQDIPPKVWNFNVFTSCLWSMFSRGIISMLWFALPFLFCLLNVFSNNAVKNGN